MLGTMIMKSEGKRLLQSQGGRKTNMTATEVSVLSFCAQQQSGPVTP